MNNSEAVIFIRPTIASSPEDTSDFHTVACSSNSQSISDKNMKNMNTKDICLPLSSKHLNYTVENNKTLVANSDDKLSATCDKEDSAVLPDRFTYADNSVVSVDGDKLISTEALESKTISVAENTLENSDFADNHADLQLELENKCLLNIKHGNKSIMPVKNPTILQSDDVDIEINKGDSVQEMGGDYQTYPKETETESSILEGNTISNNMQNSNDNFITNLEDVINQNVCASTNKLDAVETEIFPNKPQSNFENKQNYSENSSGGSCSKDTGIHNDEYETVKNLLVDPNSNVDNISVHIERYMKEPGLEISNNRCFISSEDCMKNSLSKIDDSVTKLERFMKSLKEVNYEDDLPVSNQVFSSESSKDGMISSTTITSIEENFNIGENNDLISQNISNKISECRVDIDLPLGADSCDLENKNRRKRKKKNRNKNRKRKSKISDMEGRQAENGAAAQERRKMVVVVSVFAAAIFLTAVLLIIITLHMSHNMTLRERDRYIAPHGTAANYMPSVIEHNTSKIVPTLTVSGDKAQNFEVTSEINFMEVMDQFPPDKNLDTDSSVPPYNGNTTFRPTYRLPTEIPLPCILIYAIYLVILHLTSATSVDGSLSFSVDVAMSGSCEIRVTVDPPEEEKITGAKSVELYTYNPALNQPKLLESSSPRSPQFDAHATYTSTQGLYYRNKSVLPKEEIHRTEPEGKPRKFSAPELGLSEKKEAVDQILVIPNSFLQSDLHGSRRRLSNISIDPPCQCRRDEEIIALDDFWQDKRPEFNANIPLVILQQAKRPRRRSDSYTGDDEVFENTKHRRVNSQRRQSSPGSRRSTKVGGCRRVSSDRCRRSVKRGDSQNLGRQLSSRSLSRQISTTSDVSSLSGVLTVDGRRRVSVDQESASVIEEVRYYIDEASNKRRRLIVTVFTAFTMMLFALAVIMIAATLSIKK